MTQIGAHSAGVQPAGREFLEISPEAQIERPGPIWDPFWCGQEPAGGTLEWAIGKLG